MTSDSKNNTYFTVSTSHKLNFSAAHFICHHNWREFLHGHNYKVELSAEGPEFSSETGFLCDFLEIEGPLREIIQEFKGKFILPTQSPHLTFSEENDEITIRYKETKRFVFPSEDCYKVPCKYSTCEDLASWLLDRLMAKLGENFLKERNVHVFRLTLYEAKARMASITKKIDYDSTVQVA